MSADDYLLALQLQEFDSLDDDIPQIVQESRKDKENKPSNNSANHRSLVDPSWETIDPTPDIHALFLQFNQTFFWKKLDAVEVKWSPRMTLCAGVCVYKGRGGCSIRLSLPLLKLRPRKDLIETLLHEMIHAYLFVTHNNKDRDGHGPEFHKHMYRINQDAGTNISVYHSFHDEVKLYQQHWWRCDGPCQKRPPFFGMVRRSMNRAPGPYDNWFADHQATCGGNFIKVKEPEGYKDKKKSKATPSTSKGGLTNYFPNISKSSSGGLPKNVSGFGNLNNPSVAPPKPLQGSSVNNVVGFKDLNGTSQPKKPPKNQRGGQGKKLGGTGNNRSGTSGGSARPGNFGRPGGAGGMLANRGGGTLVVTGKGKKTDDNKPLTDLSTFTPFGGSGNILGTKSTSNTSVKNPLASSFNTPTSTKPSSRSPSSQPDLSRWLPSSTPVKRPSDTQPSCSKSTKSEPEIINLSPSESSQQKHAMVRCPLCFIEVSEIDVNGHLDECLTRPSGSGAVPKDEKTEPCPVCNEQVSSRELQSHVNVCVSNSFGEDDLTEIIDEKANVDKKEDAMDVSDEEDGKKKCPVCDKRIFQGALSDHLEVCEGLQCSQNSVILDDESDDEENEAAGGSPQKSQSGEKLYPCPVCTHLFAESCMNKHLDVCMSP